MLVSSQDVQWNDIDYMDRFMDFTFDSTNFATLPELVKDLHAHDQRYVMILVRRSLIWNSCVFLVCFSACVYVTAVSQPAGPRYKQHSA